MKNVNQLDTIDAIIVAAGSGSRLGASVPKAFVPLNGKPLLSYAFDRFRTHPLIQNVIIVVPGSMLEESKKLFWGSMIHVIEGGSERWESVSNSLSCSTAEWILVHDAARPFVTHDVIDSVISLRKEFECGFTATPEIDTIRIYENNTAQETVDRSKLIRVGTPQLFKRELLQSYVKTASALPQPPTDEVMLFQAQGKKIGFTWGDPKNFKITTPQDLEIAEALCAKNSMPMGR